MADYKNIMIYGEIVEGELAAITKELLGGGRRLADELSEQLLAIFVGDKIAEPAREALAFGADKVYVVDDARLNDYETELYTVAMTKVVDQEKPRILLFGHTDTGADLGPRLAFRLRMPIATDCVELTIDLNTKCLLRTKPVYGGLAMAVFASEDFPQMATVRAKSLPPAQRKNSLEAASVTVAVDFPRSAPRVTVLEKVTEEVEGVKLEDADIVVSGGRGIGDAEGFKKLEEAARFLKGAVGASRVAVDNGWVSSTMQVGITGKIVAPAVYIAVAISGASQHMTGCSGAKTIVAINKDPMAPIFKQAQFGVVGDWKILLPAFIDKLKELE
jgi:electron transfer flavoprotein alpha subunit